MGKKIKICLTISFLIFPWGCSQLHSFKANQIEKLSCYNHSGHDPTDGVIQQIGYQLPDDQINLDGETPIGSESGDELAGGGPRNSPLRIRPHFGER